MNTCKTCKYFGPRYDHFGQSLCTNPNLKSLKQNGLYADNNHDSMKDLVILVGPDFGCIHHESL